MKTISAKTRIAFFLISAFVFLGVNFSTAAMQEETKRQRVIEKPTPTVTPSSVVPKPSVSPSPAQSPSPFPTISAPVQTVAQLQAKIRSAISRPELRRGIVAVKIASLNAGKVIYEENAERYVMPASNMKSFTVAAALEKLSPNYRFITSVYADSLPDASGAIKGNLTIFGRGDVSISTAFSEGDYFKGLDALADKIVQSGVRRVEGGLVADESYFSGSPIPTGWEWDDLQWYYGAEVSALPLNDNALDLTVKPGSLGSSCIVQIQPFNSIMRVVNRCTTSAAGTKKTLTIKKDLDQNVLEVSGSLPIGDKGFADPLAISRPAELFAALLRQRLQAKGVTIAGQTQIVKRENSVIDRALTAAQNNSQTVSGKPAPIEIAKLESAPFSLIAAKTMKPSQNLYTETILWTLGEQMRSFYTNAAGNPFANPNSTSAERGIFVVQDFLRNIGVSADSVVQYDGSGLSRHNLVTADSLVKLYTYMAKQSRYAQTWRDSLTVGAVDGTLRNRFKGTAAAENVRGKTGTIDQVSALSGYLTTAAGEPLVFSIIVNGVPNSRARTAIIDDIVLHLANYTGAVN